MIVSSCRQTSTLDLSLVSYASRLKSPNILIAFAGEDALANLSIEKEGDNGPVTGFMRIRSRSQGLALSLGSLKGLNKVGETA